MERQLPDVSSPVPPTQLDKRLPIIRLLDAMTSGARANRARVVPIISWALRLSVRLKEVLDPH